MATSQPASSPAKPVLYHAPSSYYSMIARLALAEAGIDHAQVFMDIHLRCRQQSPAYARLNPNMTVPTLVLPGQILVQSRDILNFAVQPTHPSNPQTEAWLDLHYAYPVEELTFGGLLARSRLARTLIPARLAAIHRRLLKLAAANPDLAHIYQTRAALFAQRLRVFNPQAASALLSARREQAIAILNRLDAHLAHGEPAIVPPHYGAADIVFTVFLARMEFAGLAHEVFRRPHMARYYNAMKSRPGFAAADIWTRIHFMRMVRGVVFDR
jgi:glutathione S-transferase